MISRGRHLATTSDDKTASLCVLSLAATRRRTLISRSPLSIRIGRKSNGLWITAVERQKRIVASTGYASRFKESFAARGLVHAQRNQAPVHASGPRSYQYPGGSPGVDVHIPSLEKTCRRCSSCVLTLMYVYPVAPLSSTQNSSLGGFPEYRVAAPANSAES